MYNKVYMLKLTKIYKIGLIGIIPIYIIYLLLLIILYKVKNTIVSLLKTLNSLCKHNKILLGHTRVTSYFIYLSS